MAEHDTQTAYRYCDEIQLPSLINVLDRETADLCEEFIHLDKDNQLERINDLWVLVKTIKQLSDEAIA